MLTLRHLLLQVQLRIQFPGQRREFSVAPHPAEFPWTSPFPKRSRPVLPSEQLFHSSAELARNSQQPHELHVNIAGLKAGTAPGGRRFR